MQVLNKNIIFSDDAIVKEFSELLEKEDINLINTQTFSSEMFEDSFSLLFIDNDFPKSNLEKIISLRKSSDKIFFSIIFVSKDGTELISDVDIIDDIILMPLNSIIFKKKIKKYFFDLYLKYQATVSKKELEHRSKEIKKLSQIGSMLMMEKDLDKLLYQILLKSREITNADAGSLYLIEEKENNEKYLRFKLSQNDSLDTSYEEFTMPISKKSIAGYVAVTDELLNIEDAYQIPPEKKLKFNKDFDQKFGYRTKSMLTAPLKKVFAFPVKFYNFILEIFRSF